MRRNGTSSTFSQTTGRSLLPCLIAALSPLALCAVLLLCVGLISAPPLAAQTAPATHPCVHATVSGTTIATALGECSAPTADATSIDHFEADLRYGSFDTHHTDLVPIDFSAVPLLRFYLSRAEPGEDIALPGTQTHAFGLNTTRSFDGAPVDTTTSHSGARTITEVRSRRGSAIHLAYDARSRIWAAADDHSNTARYFYGSDGMLCYAFDTAGMVRHYTYDGTLMTAVEDEHRQTLVRNAYTAGHLASQQFANGDIYKFAYNWPPGGSTARTVTVTLPDHTTKVVSLTAASPLASSTQ